MSEYSELSREAEIGAVKAISSFVGDLGIVIDTGKTAPFDFEIRYSDGRLAIGEVSVLEDGDYRSGWNALLKQEVHHIEPLPEGSGYWVASLRRSNKTAHIGSFLKKVPSFILKLKEQNVAHFDIFDDWPITPLSELGRDLGITRIYQMEGMEGDFLFYNYQSTAGFIPTNTEALLLHLDGLLHGGPFQSNWEKLIPFSAQEKHLFFRCGSLIPGNLHECFLTPGSSDFMTPFRFPFGITHLWLTSNRQKSSTLLWISDGRKFLIPQSGAPELSLVAK